MSYIEQAIEIHAPVEVVYEEWVNFEQFPLFMERVKDVQQVTPTLFYWQVEISGVRHAWAAEIVEHVPCSHVAWKATRGADHSGTINFHPIDPQTTRAVVRMDYRPKTLLEKLGQGLGIVEMAILQDLENFKEFVERGLTTPIQTWEQQTAPL